MPVNTAVLFTSPLDPKAVSVPSEYSLLCSPGAWHWWQNERNDSWYLYLGRLAICNYFPTEKCSRTAESDSDPLRDD